MTLEEAIKHAEEVAKEKQEQADSNIQFERNGTKFLYDGEEYKKCCKCAEEHRQLAEWLKELKQLREQTRWIPVSEGDYPKPEDEYKRFLTIDNKGEITIQEFLLSLDEEPQPYFTGWRNIVAYMPLPEVYKEK